MKELTALTGLRDALLTISTTNGYLTNVGNNVLFGRAYFNDSGDLPIIAIAPGDSDSINNRVGKSSEYNITATITVEAAVEAATDDIAPIYNTIHDITKCALAWVPTDPSDNIRLEYAGKTVTWPEELRDIALVQVRFNIFFIDDLGA